MMNEPQPAERKARPALQFGRREKGYAMVAVLAAMTISLIVMSATLPSLKHSMQREREEEMFFRAEQIANAIVRYQREHGNQFPTSLEQLTEIDPASQSKRYLRASALKDPMTKAGEWRLVRPGDQALKDLAQAWINVMKQPPPPLLAQMAGIGPGTPGNTGLGDNDEAKDDKSDSPLSEGVGPIVAVVSKSKERVIRNYFKLETYDKCVVFPGIPTPDQIVIPGLPLVGVIQPPTANKPNDPRCPRGGIPFEVDGRTVCTGVLYDGQCPPSDPKCRPGK